MVFLRKGSKGEREGREITTTKTEVSSWKLTSQTTRTTLKKMYERPIYFPLFSPLHPLACRYGNFMNFSSIFEHHYKKKLFFPETKKQQQQNMYTSLGWYSGSCLLLFLIFLIILRSWTDALCLHMQGCERSWHIHSCSKAAKGI